jgi:hypothetical protein
MTARFLCDLAFSDESSASGNGAIALDAASAWRSSAVPISGATSSQVRERSASPSASQPALCWRCWSAVQNEPFFGGSA